MSFIENQAEGDPGSIVGWAKIIPTSFRFVRFVSPRTGNYSNGMCVQLEGESQEVWILSSGQFIWKRAEPWQRSAYLKKMEIEQAGDENDKLDSDVNQL